MDAVYCLRSKPDFEDEEGVKCDMFPIRYVFVHLRQLIQKRHGREKSHSAWNGAGFTRFAK